jgi:hypothetical protein
LAALIAGAAAPARGGLVASETAKAAPVSKARLQGDFRVVQRITAVEGFKMRVGQTSRIDYTFRPKCRLGACNVVMSFRVRNSFSDLLPPNTVGVNLKRAGAVYTGKGWPSLSRCGDLPTDTESGRLDVRIIVRAGRLMNGIWRATRLSGSLRYSTSGTDLGFRGSCPPSSWEATLTGSYFGESPA